MAGPDRLVLVVAEEPGSRLGELLQQAAGSELLLEVRQAPGEREVAQALEQGVRCALVDLRRVGLAALARLRAAAPEAQLLVLAPPGAEAEGLAALRCGADDALALSALDPAALGQALTGAAGRLRPGAGSLERSLVAAVERSADMVALIDGEGTTHYVSPSVRDVLGLEPSEYVGRRSMEPLFAEDRQVCSRAFREVLTRVGGFARFEFRLLHRDGRCRWLEASATNLLHLPPVRSVVVSYRDITGRKEVEAELRAAKQRLDFLLSGTSAVTFSCRPDGDFGATFISENISAMMGYRPSDFLTDSRFWIDRVHPEDLGRVQAEIVHVFEAGRHAYDYRFLHRDGSYRWVHDEISLVRDEAGRPVEMVGSWIDITDRKEAEAALSRSEANFRNLIESLPTAVMAHRQDRIVYANPAMLALLGWSERAQFCGRSPSELVPPDDRPIIARRVEQARATGRSEPREQRLMRRDGSMVVAETEARLLPFDGSPTVVVFARDLSERRAMLARVSAVDQLVSVGMLAAGAAHELNNPLSYVISNLTVLADAAPRLTPGPGSRLNPADVPRLIEDARDGASRMAAVVRDLRTLSRADEGQRAPTDVHLALGAAIRMAHNEIRHRARLVEDYQAVSPVQASEGQLVQVFLNLLVNAAQAIPDGNAGSNQIRVRTRTAVGGGVVVEVTDTGSGIAAEHLGRVFDPFFTTKPAGEGTGLGLAICQGIVQAMGGELTAESAPGQGATFRVSLPAGAAQAPAPQPPLPAVAVGQRLRVLVVDDEPRLGISLRYLLAPDHELALEESARRALERLASGERFAAILCDLMMPEMNGIEFHTALCRLAPECARRVVFVTGGAFTPVAREFLARVPNPCLEKPIPESALREAIRRVST